MAGYSGTPLSKKLGIKEGYTVSVISGPKQFPQLVAPLPAGVTLRNSARGRADLSLLFVDTRAALAKRIETIWRLAFPDRSVWICWPKKSGALFVDLTEDDIRRFVLPRGLVDVKVCALDKDWSALKLVVRKELREDC